MNHSSLFLPLMVVASSLSLSACLTPDFDFGVRGGVASDSGSSSSSESDDERTLANNVDSSDASELDGMSGSENPGSGDDSSNGADNSSSGDSSSGDSSSGDSSSGDSSSGDNNSSDPVDPVDPTPHCLNREVDKDETDTDCGGLDCAGCRDGQTCSIDSDCESSACDDDKTCITPTCFDGKKNGDESGADCGGSCSDKCNADEGCFGDSDCESVVCEDRVCLAPACDDGVLNGDETDVDCGGADCAACEYGAACRDDADCSVESNSSGSAVCSAEGTCSITCNSGTADCTADGICNDISSDKNRCGGCLDGDPVKGSGQVCSGAGSGQVNVCENSSCSIITECKSAWNDNGTYTGRPEVSFDFKNWKCKNNGTFNCNRYSPLIKANGTFGDASTNLWALLGSCQ